MKKNFTKIFALFLILAMLCTGCGLSGAPVDSAPDGGGTPATDGKEPAEPAGGDKDVTVGLARDVYEIPDYTNAAPGTKVLRLSVSMGASDYGTSASGVMFKTFVDRIEELSGGAMVAQVYPANQLASTTDDIINGLLSGAFEMSEVGQANWGDYTTAFTPMNVPFMYSSNEVAYEVMSGETGDAMAAQLLADTGIRAEGFMYLGMRTITNNSKEIHSPADLKGLKIRVQSDPTQLSTFEELGASTMTVSFSELFTALQQKLCDGQDNPIISIVSRKFYEVQNYITMLNHLPNISMFVMSDAYYQSLSAEEQAWVDQAAQDATEACYKTLMETEGVLIDQLIQYGINVTYLTDEEYDAFADAVPNTWAMCQKTMGDDAWNSLLAAVAAAEAKAG
ncbi:TRAP transporter substrate-binding protein [Oscillibacter sp.]|uniref:TRAP transporter substrate-binding protein n=1 Tax=Oscillibacter sp. TaxID=1945593 RepID=UPI0021737143|nr:TRAP transporter substrate-binding protein [Oscillibacter sp.]MCI9648834.1 TRAP transporter substrate-binding protein [Oscillibacter sp.]